MAGRTQSRFAACPAKRVKGNAIVSDGSKERGVYQGLDRYSEFSVTLSKDFRRRWDTDDAFDFLRWRLIYRFWRARAFRIQSMKAKNGAIIVRLQPSWLQSQYRLKKPGGGRCDTLQALPIFIG